MGPKTHEERIKGHVFGVVNVKLRASRHVKEQSTQSRHHQPRGIKEHEAIVKGNRLSKVLLFGMGDTSYNWGGPNI